MQMRMPSPATLPPRRSSSDPELNITISKAKTRIPRSSRSTASSSRHSKSSYWISWSNISKLGDYINKRRSNESSKHSDLTEECLDAHNKLNGTLSHRLHISKYISSEGDLNSNCSPYYRGLTDSTLSINREKNMARAYSPGRESHTNTVASNSSGSLSTLFFKVQEFSSICFSRRKTGNKDPPLAAVLKPVKPTYSSSTLANKDLPPPAVLKPAEPITYSSSTFSNKDPSPAAVLKPVEPTYSSSTFPRIASWEETEPEREEAEPEREEATHPPAAQLLFAKEKPLRERVPEPSAPASPTVLPDKTVIDDDEKKEDNIYKLNQKFVMADKYRPKALKDFICNRGQAARLQALMKNEGCNHIIFEGPPGVGKRTMIWAMLREIFGPDRVQAREECKAFYLKGESIRRIEVIVKESSKHVEVNLSDLRGYEKHVIVELMKETQTKNSPKCSPENCRAIILCEADKLSTDALLYIRWLIERYKGCNKVFFCCSDVSRLEPIRSLCIPIQLLPPSKEEIVEVLEFIAKQEGIYLPHNLAEKIADNSKNNLRQAIRSFEACWHSSYPFQEDQEILTGWEEDIANIAKDIVEERSPKQLYIIRGKLQNLIEHDVSPEFIFKSLVQEVKKHLQEDLHPQIDGLYNEYSRCDTNFDCEDEETKVIDQMKKNMKIFSRIEEFIARFMSWYNNQLRNMANAADNTAPLAKKYNIFLPEN